MLPFPANVVVNKPYCNHGVLSIVSGVPNDVLVSIRLAQVWFDLQNGVVPSGTVAVPMKFGTSRAPG
jgi:hypothetical protein